MSYKTATKSELVKLADQLVGPQIEEAKQAILDEVTRHVEMRISAISGRLSQVEERADEAVKATQRTRAAQLAELRYKVSIGDLERHSSGVNERLDSLEQKIAALSGIAPTLAAVSDSLTELGGRLGALDVRFARLREGALKELLDEVREQAVQRDKELYRRIQELGERTKAAIAAEKQELSRQFKESVRIFDGRRESVSKLQEQVSKALSKYGSAYKALLDELEAMKAGTKIGKVE